MSQRCVVICADDFGQHEGINNACLQLARQGRISAVSCLTGGPSWSEAGDTVARLARLPVDLGLHLDFTDYTMDEGLRHPLGALIGLAFSRRLDGARVGREINAQLDAFERVAGRAPDHVDGHQHVHQFPVIRHQLLQALARRYPDCKPWIRRTAATAIAGTPRLKPVVIERLGGEALSRQAQRENFRQNLHLHGVYGFDADEAGY
ncbi:MAG: ChbG/HpnK family deacetylase, partial [Ramlibacter sp.]